MKILFFADTAPDGASLVHRGHLMSRELQKYGIEVKVYAGLLRHNLFNIPLPNLKTYLSVIARLKYYDILILHRQGNLLAYLILLLSKLLGKKTIFDFDDALFVHQASRHKILHTLWYGFLPKIIRRCDMVTAGSQFLAEYARNYNTNVHLIPTPVDTSIFYPQAEASHSGQKITIGWMGLANFHVQNLQVLAEPLAELSKKYALRLKLVSALGVKEVRQIFEKIETLNVNYGLDHLVPLDEMPKLMRDFDISVSPLRSDTFSEGKCAMKALESMAMGIPVVASAVGENNCVITDGVNGFLATTPEEWIKKLEMLIQDETLRKRIGQNGLQTIQKEGYTLEECGKKLSQLCYDLLKQ